MINTIITAIPTAMIIPSTIDLCIFYYYSNLINSLKQGKQKVLNYFMILDKVNFLKMLTPDFFFKRPFFI